MIIVEKYNLLSLPPPPPLPTFPFVFNQVSASTFTGNKNKENTVSGSEVSDPGNIDKLEMSYTHEENQIMSEFTENFEFYHNTNDSYDSTEKTDSSLHMSLFSSKPPQQNNCNALSSLVIAR